MSIQEAKARSLIEKKSAINLLEAFSVAIKHYLRGEDGIYYQLVNFSYSLEFTKSSPEIYITWLNSFQLMLFQRECLLLQPIYRMSIRRTESNLLIRRQQVLSAPPSVARSQQMA